MIKNYREQVKKKSILADISVKPEDGKEGREGGGREGMLIHCIVHKEIKKKS